MLHSFKKNSNKLKAFSLIEISIVIIIIGILVVGITKGSNLVKASKLYSAQNLTKASDVLSTPNLVAWYETTLSDSLVTGVTANTLSDSTNVENNNSIKTWKDINPKTSLKNNATAAVDNNRPTYVRDGINGLPVLRFDGTSDYFNLPDGTVPYDNSPYSVFFVSRVNSACVCGVIGSGNFTSNKSNSFRYDATSGIFNYWWTVNPFSGNNSITVNKFDIIEVVYNTSSVSFYVNGVAKTSAAYSNRASTSVNNTIGRTWAAEYMNGDIAEIIIFNRALKTNERQDVEKYLSKKWGIKLN